MMKSHFLSTYLLLFLPLISALPSAPTLSNNTRALFLFKDVLKSNTVSITTSNFNTVILFGLGILSNGSIMYYSNTPGSSDVLLTSNGAYVGGTALSSKVLSLKTATNTSIKRVEISMNSQNIGVSATVLSRSFQALKTAWGLDAVNNDDESIYDVDSTVAFAKMLGALGLKYSISPYTYTDFWVSVTSKLNSGLAADKLLMDRVYLQCYDGGAGNDPKSWYSALGMKVIPLVWVTNDSKPGDGSTVAQAKTQFQSWSKAGGVTGGGYWNDYDIEKMKSSYADYAGVLSSIFP